MNLTAAWLLLATAAVCFAVVALVMRYQARAASARRRGAAWGVGGAATYGSVGGVTYMAADGSCGDGGDGGGAGGGEGGNGGCGGGG